MQIEPITTQSVAYSQVQHGNRVVITRREHSTDQGHQTVREIAYVIYTNKGQLQETTSPTVDLRV